MLGRAPVAGQAEYRRVLWVQVADLRLVSGLQQEFVHRRATCEAFSTSGPEAELLAAQGCDREMRVAVVWLLNSSGSEAQHGLQGPVCFLQAGGFLASADAGRIEPIWRVLAAVAMKHVELVARIASRIVSSGRTIVSSVAMRSVIRFWKITREWISGQSIRAGPVCESHVLIVGQHGARLRHGSDTAGANRHRTTMATRSIMTAIPSIRVSSLWHLPRSILNRPRRSPPVVPRHLQLTQNGYRWVFLR